jgi:hypothetical protein
VITDFTNILWRVAPAVCGLTLHFNEGNWDCALADHNSLSVQVWTLLFLNVSRVTYNLRAGTTKKRMGIDFGLGLGYFRFDLRVADTRHN